MPRFVVDYFVVQLVDAQTPLDRFVVDFFCTACCRLVVVLPNCRGFVVQLVVDMSKCCGLVLYVRFAADLLWTCCGFVADLLYNKLYNKCTTNRDNGVRAQQKIREISMSCGNVSGKKLDFFSFGYSNLYLYLLDACFLHYIKIRLLCSFLLTTDGKKKVQTSE